MQTVVMPKLGDTMEEGKILQWLKQEGDTVSKGDALAEIETEKVNIEVESFASGVLRKILVPAGSTVPVGAPIALTGEASEPLPADVAGEPATAAEATHAQGQANSAPEAVRPEPVAQPAATTAASAATQQAAATLQPLTAGTNGYTPHVVNGRSATGTSVAPTQTGTEGRVFISPIARRLAAEHHVNIDQVQGTGPGGRIIRDDIELALQRQQAAPQPVAPTPQPVYAPVPATAVTGGADDVEPVALSQMRKTIARRLQQSMQTIPHFYVTMVIDTTRLGEMRESLNEYAAGLPQPIKVSFNDLVVKAVAMSLTRMPEVNASFDGEQLLLKKHVNIGVAVALEQGLIVPVVRDADKRSVLDIAQETRRLTEAARMGKLKPEEFQGGTFSVSNLGMFGVDEFTAIINPPESAILAVGAIVPTPVVRNAQVVVRDLMKVTLSVDHRALDGAVAARFLQELKRLLEQPMAMLV
ncbi:MAG: dihydrolipoamide acetyltransferase family protein [Ktedonobacterales bacterium]